MIKNENERIEKALEFATLKHEGQKRKKGEPYITHPIAVADIMRADGKDTDHIIAALFHDLLEDTDATEQEIYDIGGERVLEAVKLLTKQKDYVMEEYIDGIRKNEIAFAVKGADRLHNLRCAFDADEAFRRRYISESLKWFTDFRPEIPGAIEALEKSLD